MLFIPKRIMHHHPFAFMMIYTYSVAWCAFVIEGFSLCLFQGCRTNMGPNHGSFCIEHPQNGERAIVKEARSMPRCLALGHCIATA